jgi:hypothetical protein
MSSFLDHLHNFFLTTIYRPPPFYGKTTTLALHINYMNPTILKNQISLDNSTILSLFQNTPTNIFIKYDISTSY